MALVLEVEAKFPPKLAFLFQPARYKVVWGGRGKGGSWGFARALLIKGAQEGLRVLCLRELQTSIKDSVHKLLTDQIKLLGLGHVYEVLQNEIRGPHGTSFSFEGIRHNADKIKSYEGIDVAWVEEAQKVSKTSWNIVIPTIRKPGSEIWVGFNPEFEEDETFQRFVKSRPTNSIVVKMSWRDNPWFPDVLKQELEDLKARNFDDYLHVWEGECITVLEGAIFAEELRLVALEGRVCKVPYERGRSVDVFFDLGYSDSTALWLTQTIAMQYRYLGYYEESRKPIEHYLKWLQTQPYVYGTLWLPHDAFANRLGQSKNQTIAKQVKEAGSWRVRMVPRLSKKNQLNAARRVFPNAYFDTEGCADGLQALRNYQYSIDPTSGLLSKSPLHNWASNGSDAFLYSGIGMRPPADEELDDGESIEPERKKGLFSRNRWGAPAANSWMGH